MAPTAHNAIREANRLGQSIWLDSISRDMLQSGELARLVETGVSGVTSNPTIFEKAISEGASYDDALALFARSGGDAQRAFEGLAVDDIRAAADVLRPVYERTRFADGFVSIEVSPRLAHDSAGTVEEARRLFRAIGRPNVMIKVPGTPEGTPAIRTLIAEGLNVNVTLLFSVQAYTQAANAYIAGLRDYQAAGRGSPSHIASVASFFVSRVDTAGDKLLAQPPRPSPGPSAESLKSQLGIANARLAYEQFQALFKGPAFGDLRRAGAQVQRPLWASTSTKDPKLPDTMYVDGLIGPDTVNTLPPATLTAFLEHGTVAPSLTRDVEAARAHVHTLGEMGISLDAITSQLLTAGVKSFSDSYDKLLAQIDGKLTRLRAANTPAIAVSAGQITPATTRTEVERVCARLAVERLVERIWEGDESVWPAPSAGGARAKDRLGWLRLPESIADIGAEARLFAEDVSRAGLSDTVVLGMGGSALVAEVLRSVQHPHRGASAGMAVLDTVEPATVAALGKGDQARRLFIVASKSGTTAEPLALEAHFRQQVTQTQPNFKPEDAFAAITDAGTPLAKRSREFRRVFLAPPDVGGRFSALSVFGLVPAALMGLDIAKMSDSALRMAAACRATNAGNPGLALGVAMATLAMQGRDKLTLITSPSLARFGLWVEQLVAESLGKGGKGIVPVVGEPLLAPQLYGADRQFVYLRFPGDAEPHDRAGTLRAAQGSAALADAVEARGLPLLRLEVSEPAELAGEFFRWEFATAVAAHVMGVYPFDEPDVATAKARTQDVLKRGWARAVPEGSLTTTVERLLSQRRPGDYVAVLVYAQETPDLDSAVAGLREGISARTGMATTFGYGPRYLHSTGQLHKGGPDNVLLLVLVDESARRYDASAYADPERSAQAAKWTDAALPRLLKAQAAGDVEALRERGRRVEFVGAGGGAGSKQLAQQINVLAESWRV